MVAPRILMVVTSQATMGDTGKPTGLWLEELAVPYMRFVDADQWREAGALLLSSARLLVGAGAQLLSRLSSPRADSTAARALSHAVPIEALDATRFDAVFLPGGHGTMFDFPVSTALASALSRAWRAGRIVAAVCHGPAGLVGAVDSDGRPVVAGRRVARSPTPRKRRWG
jgi:putative intracellular protease/amidase